MLSRRLTAVALVAAVLVGEASAVGAQDPRPEPLTAEAARQALTEADAERRAALRQLNAELYRRRGYVDQDTRGLRTELRWREQDRLQEERRRRVAAIDHAYQERVRQIDARTSGR